VNIGSRFSIIWLVVGCVFLAGCSEVKEHVGRDDLLERYDAKIRTTVEQERGFVVNNIEITARLLEHVTGTRMPRGITGLEHKFLRGEGGARKETISFMMPTTSIKGYLESLGESLPPLVEHPDELWLVLYVGENFDALGVPGDWDDKTFGQAGRYEITTGVRTPALTLSVDTETGEVNFVRVRLAESP